LNNRKKIISNRKLSTEVSCFSRGYQVLVEIIRFLLRLLAFS
jgi:hypothetical protein